ncbi:MAG TPA: hypothetical protein VL371_14440 [Gemmataceae bacterium]|jgi:hypothetical protein|nr:hypothetical protein [Gemmataceae bacterium]
MNEIRFTAVINEDRTIRIPEHLPFKPGAVEVVVRPELTEEQLEAANRAFIDRLANAAKELNISGLPSDLAENHDHYVHGLPKGIDRQ